MRTTAPDLALMTFTAALLAATASSVSAQPGGSDTGARTAGEAAEQAAGSGEQATGRGERTARSAGIATGSALDAQDQLDIRQLMDRYTHVLDHCTNGGYDYADLFTPDGTFGVSSEWGGGAKIWFTGREQLAAAGGGGPNGCRPRGGTPMYHININPVITPTPNGAHAISTLLVVTNDTDDRGDIVHWEGGYEDTFEKTPAGWRFKSRVHVWPEIEWTDRPEDMPPRNMADE